jgi:uncharacterized membrane protein YeaQ/YmgE (transglycosylase-associated protein family)
MPLLLVALLVVVAVWIFFAFAGSIVHLVLMLVIAGIVGWLADLIVPGQLPWGWLGAILAGLIGSWLGVWLLGLLGMGDVGPTVFDVPIIPALVGAIILAFLVDGIGKQLRGPRPA